MSERKRQQQIKVVTEAIEGINSLIAHVEVKGKTAETKKMAKKYAKKLQRLAKTL